MQNHLHFFLLRNAKIGILENVHTVLLQYERKLTRGVQVPIKTKSTVKIDIIVNNN